MLVASLHSSAEETSHRTPTRAAATNIMVVMEADGRPTVLVVDDDASIRNLLRAVLERDGRFGRVATVAGGYDAIETCYSMRPAIVVLDLAMWDLSGYETLPVLRSRHPEIKIVLYTATYDEQTRAEALSRGADAVLAKSTAAVDMPSRLMEVLRDARSG